jgi:hypothetical protein
MIESETTRAPERKTNRAERRAMGYRGPAYMQMNGDTRPRYVRRHIEGVAELLVSGRPLTRRQRKVVARMGQHATRTGTYKEA